MYRCTKERFNINYYCRLYPELKNKNYNDLYSHLQRIRNNLVNIPNNLRHKIGISISTYSISTTPKARIDIVKKCLDSVKKAVDQYDKNLIHVNIVTDTVTKEHMDILQEYPFKIIKNKKNMGIAYTKNVGIRHIYKANCEFVFLLDDDTVIADSNIFIAYVNAMIKTGFHHFMTSNDNYTKTLRTITINNQAIKRLEDTGGWFYAFTRHSIDCIGYYQLFPGKYGHEHTEWTDRCINARLTPYYIDIVGGDKMIDATYIEMYSSKNDPEHDTVDMNTPIRLATLKQRKKNRFEYSGRSFNYYFYVNHYDDLKKQNLNKRQAYRHWILYGEDEGRKCWSEDTPEPYVIS